MHFLGALLLGTPSRHLHISQPCAFTPSSSLLIKRGAGESPGHVKGYPGSITHPGGEGLTHQAPWREGLEAPEPWGCSLSTDCDFPPQPLLFLPALPKRCSDKHQRTLISPLRVWACTCKGILLLFPPGYQHPRQSRYVSHSPGV